MNFEQALTPAVLLRRYKRFLADVRLADGTEVTAHTANTGAMLGCAEPGSRVWLSRAANPRRKYPWTWELVETDAGTLVGINTQRSNALVREAIEAGRIAALQGYTQMRAEVAYGTERSRIDWLLEGHAQRPPCYLEVKNVTLVEAGVARFPDAVSARGAKHLRELAGQAAQGRRAMVCFCIQRDDAQAMAPADAIDPAYGAGLRAAVAQGVEVCAYRARVSPEAIELVEPVPVRLENAAGAADLGP